MGTIPEATLLQGEPEVWRDSHGKAYAGCQHQEGPAVAGRMTL